ncbi:HAS barrel domain protein [Synechococcus sp. PCC 7502]|uniref:HAS barrel domain-containing protein n=1 Tax=Synechococcus sp. PCC 7502 TaxID=1173263 RepID=UPI00029FBDD4|nr:HAS barrel domain-containing protein [Synechococcus sp. PCC 7502]AFY74438.1 HAS barrel domain protein [Synechococcus sp. PCC 7502]
MTTSSLKLESTQIAEIVETASTEYIAQCLEPKHLSFPVVPAFGSWVKAIAEDQIIIYGVVYHATTMPIDSVHRAVALGLSLTELQEQQPQIFAMLKTEIKVAILGFQAENNIYQHLPSQPPQIHQAVYACSSNEINKFTDELHFLRTLIQITNAPTDELIAAILRNTYQSRQGDRQWLVASGRKLSILLKDDYDRLGAILNQVHLI